MVVVVVGKMIQEKKYPNTVPIATSTNSENKKGRSDLISCRKKNIKRKR